MNYLTRICTWTIGLALFQIGLADQVIRLVDSNCAWLNVGQLITALVVFGMWLVLYPVRDQ